jgi:uncharacterized protein YhfF
MPSRIEDYWEACRRELPGATAGRGYRVKCFGSDPAMSRLLLDLIRSGQKTGTFGLEWEFEDRPEERPAPGDLFIVTDSAGEPGTLIRVTGTAVLPFSAIGDEHLQCEGPALRELPLWRKLHWDFWTPALRAMGREPAEDMPILFQRFEVLKG